jgi:hypothetical protein
MRVNRIRNLIMHSSGEGGRIMLRRWPGSTPTNSGMRY